MGIVSTGVLGVAVGVIRWERESGGIGNVKNAIGSYGNEKPAGNSVDDTHTHVYTLQLREHSRNPARHLFQRFARVRRGLLSQWRILADFYGD